MLASPDPSAPLVGEPPHPPKIQSPHRSQQLLQPLAFITHAECALHTQGPTHPESPERHTVIDRALRRNFPGIVPLDAPLATRELLLLAHTEAHVDRVLRLCERAEAASAAAAARGRGRGRGGESGRKAGKRRGGRRKQAGGRGVLVPVGEDIVVCEHSRAAALRAAGACVLAVDMVCGSGSGSTAAGGSRDVDGGAGDGGDNGSSMDGAAQPVADASACGRARGRARTALCIVRPPGHHAGPEEAMGFCLFNNVAIAALYAQATYGRAGRRVAVVDFDVHHGNGTEAILRGRPDFLYVSTHQHGNDFYPATGDAATPYPDLAASDTSSSTTRSSSTGAAASVDVALGNGLERAPMTVTDDGNILNVPLPHGAGSAAFRRSFENQVLPVLERFAPDLLLMISCGFDAHAADPLADMELLEDDFRWATEKLCVVAARHCGGRVVSALEGGYDLAAIAACAVEHACALREAAVEAEAAHLSVEEDAMAHAEATGVGAAPEQNMVALESAIGRLQMTEQRCLGGATTPHVGSNVRAVAGTTEQLGVKVAGQHAAAATAAREKSKAALPVANTKMSLRLQISRGAGHAAVPLVLGPSSSDCTVEELLRRSAQKLKLKNKGKGKKQGTAKGVAARGTSLAAVLRRGGTRITDAEALRALPRDTVVDIVTMQNDPCR